MPLTTRRRASLSQSSELKPTKQSLIAETPQKKRRNSISKTKEETIYTLPDTNVLVDEDSSESFLSSSVPEQSSAQLTEDTSNGCAVEGENALEQKREIPTDYSTQNQKDSQKKKKSTRRLLTKSFQMQDEVEEKEFQISPEIQINTKLDFPIESSKEMTKMPVELENSNLNFIENKSKQIEVETEEIEFNQQESFLQQLKETSQETPPTLSLADLETAWEMAVEEEAKAIHENPESDKPLEKEPLVRDGVSATLKMLAMRGILKNTSTMNDHAENAPIDNTYRPSFELKYQDKSGRELTPKEAFKRLCHRFHGKPPGKQKMEKLLRRIAQEKTANKTSDALQRSLEDSGNAYLILGK